MKKIIVGTALVCMGTAFAGQDDVSLPQKVIIHENINAQEVKINIEALEPQQLPTMVEQLQEVRTSNISDQETIATLQQEVKRLQAENNEKLLGTGCCGVMIGSQIGMFALGVVWIVTSYYL